MTHKKKTIPMDDPKAAYEKAANEIRELRRKGIPCHLEDESDGRKNYVDVMEDDEPSESDPSRDS